jgi:hypothetical protein
MFDARRLKSESQTLCRHLPEECPSLNMNSNGPPQIWEHGRSLCLENMVFSVSKIIWRSKDPSLYARSTWKDHQKGRSASHLRVDFTDYESIQLFAALPPAAIRAPVIQTWKFTSVEEC